MLRVARRVFVSAMTHAPDATVILSCTQRRTPARRTADG